MLVNLNVQGHDLATGDDASEVSALLWAAFLCNLRDDFQAGRDAADWPLNCVILVDNADVTGDSSFLDELITARRRHAAPSIADPDPLTVLVHPARPGYPHRGDHPAGGPGRPRRGHAAGPRGPAAAVVVSGPAGPDDRGPG